MIQVIEFFKSKIQRIIGVLLFIITIATVVLILPMERRFEYEFQKGKPWMHEDLYAPFDFPIYKNEAELLRERDSIVRNFKYYFALDTSVINSLRGTVKSAILKKAYSDEKSAKFIKKDSAQFFGQLLSFIDKQLGTIYNTGIISSSEFNRLELDENSEIVLITGKIARELKIGGLWQLSNAKEYFNANVESIGELERYSFLLDINLPAMLKSNVLFDADRSEEVRSSLMASVSLTRGMVQEDERIISKGDIVDEESFKILASLKREYESSNVKSSDIYKILLGQILIILPSILALALLIFFVQPKVLESSKKSLFIIIMVISFLGITSLVSRYEVINAYAIPFIVLPIIIKTFINVRIALFTHIITVLIAGSIVPNSFEFTFLQIITGVITLFTLGNTYKRSYLFYASIVSFVTYCVIYLGISILHELDWTKIQFWPFRWFFMSSALILMSYPLIFVFERTFGFLSELRLIELSDTNNTVLRRLSDNAPGTFQHSLQVANLSEFAIKRIGGHSLLTRVGALYHDIGKQLNPSYFTENQLQGANPHDEHTPRESAKIIIDHVIEGVKLGKKHNLPEEIIAFIKTHHGTTKVKYFYTKLRNEQASGYIDPADFTYPYHCPETKEQAVVMMADAVEATSRSLQIINEDTLRGLIDKIIDSQIAERQFEDADITMKDITIVKQCFLSRLKNIYHARISYPELKTHIKEDRS